MKRFLSKIFLSVSWLLFTVAFAGWWFYFSYSSINHLAELEPLKLARYEMQRRMIVWEGATWIVLLIVGGAMLIYFIILENRRTVQVEEFFASFSHDVKTSLASLRLQAETLQEEMPSSPILDRLVADTVRLQLQLENSLYFAAQRNLKLFMEPLSLNHVLRRVSVQWPNLKIRLEQECLLKADERALQSVLGNLIQNAIVHGQASEVSFLVKRRGAHQVEVHFADNGRGFKGDMSLLGRLFYRATTQSGSGLGLYICGALLGKMNGELKILPKQQGFGGYFVLEGNVS